MKENYQIILEKILKKDDNDNQDKRLLLHVCCAPCSSYCLEYLACHYAIDVYFYNPNITDMDEYEKRAKELVRFVDEFNSRFEGKISKNENRIYKKVNVILGSYEPDKFFNMAKGLEEAPEGGSRCKKCYELRLRQSAVVAKEGAYDYFTTSLSISPYKNAQWLNEIGRELVGEFGVNYLFSDFKKKNGYKRSIELSNEYNLYRQDFCGCVYSKREK